MKLCGKHVGVLIKRYRLARNRSQNELSFQLGYRNGQYISNIERNMCSFPIDKIVQCAEILNIPLDELKEVLVLDYSIAIEAEIEKQLSNNKFVDENQCSLNFTH